MFTFVRNRVPFHVRCKCAGVVKRHIGVPVDCDEDAVPVEGNVILYVSGLSDVCLRVVTIYAQILVVPAFVVCIHGCPLAVMVCVPS